MLDYGKILQFLAQNPPQLDFERRLHASLLELLAQGLRFEDQITGQDVARITRHVRHYRKHGKPSEARDARLSFQTEHVIVVPSDKGQKQPNTR